MAPKNKLQTQRTPETSRKWKIKPNLEHALRFLHRLALGHAVRSVDLQNKAVLTTIPNQFAS